MSIMRTYHAHFTGAYVAECPTCHRICAGWDDDDLNDDGQLECPCDATGVCEMETDTWCCGNIDTLTETSVQPNPNSDHTEYRHVCNECRQKYGTTELGVCDICDEPYVLGSDNHNTETGNHRECEATR